MKVKIKLSISVIVLFLSAAWGVWEGDWLMEKHQQYNLYYGKDDANNIRNYNKAVANGIKTTETFFKSTYASPFLVYIHPDRQSLDSTWKVDWKMPNFKSECWMVASGTGTRLDMISPVKWQTMACEHNYADSLKSQQLITHELIHVYHGQKNPSPDFSNTNRIDWFVEGLATYASGQCNEERLVEVKKAIQQKTVPATLEKFWTGKLRYGLSGSVVRFIDLEYGREKLIGLASLTTLTDILKNLNTTEEELLRNWKNSLLAQ